MKKVIQFEPHEIEFEQDFLYPAPASKSSPTWYKDLSPWLDQDLKDFKIENKTVKSCPPFLDSLSSGYIYRLPVDVEFIKTQDGLDVRWLLPGDNVISNHNPRQFSRDGLSPYSFEGIFKWQFPFTIKTPPGYSVLFTHPLNRYDLPFLTLSGIVECDAYPERINFPFQLLEFKGDRLLVEHGTPIVQMIPIKRDSWTHEKKPFVHGNKEKSFLQLKKIFHKSYKRQWWVKKEYQ
jgi:hypothetical protein